MTAPLASEPAFDDLPRSRTYTAWVGSILRTRPSAVLGALVLTVIVLAALLTPVIAPYDTTEQVGRPFQPPSSAHPLGLDDAGVDMLSQMLWGSRTSLLVGFTAALIAMVIGGSIGLLAGFYGGRTDLLLMRVTDYMLVIPDVAFMLVVAAIWGRSLTNIILIIGVLYWARTARLIRAQTKSLRERVFVTRCRTLGFSNSRILVRHVLPHVVPLLIATTVLGMSLAVFAETAISFLGQGDPKATSWGRLIQTAFEGGALTSDAWWAIVPPGLAVALVILSCSLIGRGLEESLNPRLRVGHLSVHPFRVKALQVEDYKQERGTGREAAKT